MLSKSRANSDDQTHRRRTSRCSAPAAAARPSWGGGGTSIRGATGTSPGSGGPLSRDAVFPRFKLASWWLEEHDCHDNHHTNLTLPRGGSFCCLSDNTLFGCRRVIVLRRCLSRVFLLVTSGSRGRGAGCCCRFVELVQCRFDRTRHALS